MQAKCTKKSTRPDSIMQIFELRSGTKLAGRHFLKKRETASDVQVKMNNVHQLASALLAIIFAAVMVVVGHRYIENRSTRIPTLPTVQTFVP